MLPVKVIDHNETGRTLVFGFDHPQYSHNPCGAPDEIVNAVYAGFGKTVPEFDFRTFEWRDETPRAVAQRSLC
jgi:hypothetical protein